MALGDRMRLMFCNRFGDYNGQNIRRPSFCRRVYTIAKYCPDVDPRTQMMKLRRNDKTVWMSCAEHVKSTYGGVCLLSDKKGMLLMKERGRSGAGKASDYGCVTASVSV